MEWLAERCRFSEGETDAVYNIRGTCFLCHCDRMLSIFQRNQVKKKTSQEAS